MQYLESVDNSLRLLLLVARGNKIGVSEAAAELGVAPSTAYRILSTMRYRGFVVKTKSRMYQAGPAFISLMASQSHRIKIEDIALPHLEALRDATNETTHLSVLAGTQAKILASAECEQVLRVGVRTGATFPAHLASGGKALLAELPEAELDRLYPAAGLPSIGLTRVRMTRLRRELLKVRVDGYAVNIGQTERGVAAIGVTVRDQEGPVAAISVTLPTVRFSPAMVPQIVAELHRSAADLAAEFWADVTS